MKKNDFFNGIKVFKKSISCKKKRCHYWEVAAYFLFTTPIFSNVFAFICNRLKWSWIKISYYCKLCRKFRLVGQYTFPKTTFLLCVRPKNTLFKELFLKKTQPIAKNFPPPGYGIPPGYDDFVKKYNYKPSKEYGLYLCPGRINAAFYFLTWLLAGLIFTPFLYEFGYSYVALIITYYLLGYSLYKFLFTKMMPTSLTQVWEKWPIPAYELFLSVPHSVSVSWHDRLTRIKKTSCKNNEHDKDALPTNYQKPQKYIFWNPDTKTPMWRQSTESSPNMHTLQELILNLAVFEFLFHRNNHQSVSQDLSETSNPKPLERVTPKVESIREYHWYFFLFSPILINLLLILLSIFLFSALKGEEAIQCSSIKPSSEIQKQIHTTCITKNYQYSSQCSSIELCSELQRKAYETCIEKGYQFSSGFRLLLHFPYNIVIAVLTWFLFTLFYVSWILESLTDLSKKIRQDYFNAHLELIPQQILNQLSYIPTQQQIDSGIAYVKTILNWSSSIVFLGLMAVLEIFSQSASRMHIDYEIGEKTFALLMKIKVFIIGG
jgi:hypothetical protein